ncbi:uncharacterized protein LOC144584735 isoform X2 [Pogona vitticeps]
MEQMRAKLQEAEEQQGILRAEERKFGAELAERSLAMEVASMARQLQDLLPRKAGRLSFSQGPHRSPAVFSSGHTLPAVREICQDTQHYLQELRHEAEMQEHEILPVQKEKGCYPHLRSSCSRLLNGTSFSSQSGFSTPKLLRLLQGQIRDLRAEKAGYHGGSPDHLCVFREDLANTDTEAKGNRLWGPHPLHCMGKAPGIRTPTGSGEEQDSKQAAKELPTHGALFAAGTMTFQCSRCFGLQSPQPWGF